MLAGPVPARVLRAAQFHEFVEQLVAWGTQGEVAYVQKMRIQPVAARTVAEALVDLALEPVWTDGPIREVAGPREESLVEIATLWATRRGLPVRIQGITNPADPDGHLYESGALLAGPTFEAWLDAAIAVARAG